MLLTRLSIVATVLVGAMNLYAFVARSWPATALTAIFLVVGLGQWALLRNKSPVAAHYVLAWAIATQFAFSMFASAG